MSIDQSASEAQFILEIIRQAQALHGTWGPALSRNPRIQSLMESLNLKMEASWRLMAAIGLIDACRHCDEEEGGSCCGRGIENKYSPVLLLANLLAGVTFPLERFQANGCFFLGETGCTLKIRDVLCVNYLCDKIQKMLPHEELVRLQTTTGKELDEVFILQETIRKCMRP